MSRESRGSSLGDECTAPAARHSCFAKTHNFLREFTDLVFGEMAKHAGIFVDDSVVRSLFTAVVK